MRDGFLLPEDIIYLDGNSLGPLPAGVPEAVRDAVHVQWGERLAESYMDWMEVPRRVGDRIGRLLGAAPGQVSVGDSTSVQIFNALVAAARTRPGRRLVLTDSDHFPTDRYLAESAARLLHKEVWEVPVAEMPAALAEHGSEVAVVACPAVDYRTGELWDIGGLTAAAHAAGAVVVWDVCHAVGALPLDLDRHGVDFAVGCTYKYLCGGPGAPAFLYLAHRHQQEWDQPLTGWLGHAAPFALGRSYEPAPGITRATIGTPAVLSLIALEAALDVFDTVSIADVRAKSIELTTSFIEGVDAKTGLEVVTPRDPARRGSQVSLRHQEAYGFVRALMERRVIGDMRPPDLLRFGFNALFVSNEDVRETVRLLAEIEASGAHLDPRLTRRGHFG